MNRYLRIRRWGVAVVLSATIGVAHAQRNLDYDYSVVNQMHIDARDLGYPPIDVIPAGETAVHALTTAADGRIYGVTGGAKSHLFVLYPVHGYVQPLGFINGVTDVRQALVISGAGDVYVGAASSPGHLYRYQPPANEDARPIRVDQPCPVTDLGGPSAGETILALTIDPRHEIIYGLTSPSGHFFSYGLHDSRFELHGDVATAIIPGEKFEAHRLVGRALVIDASGCVYGSGEGGHLFRYDPETKQLARLPLVLPGIPGREPYTRVDAWVADANGKLYGGTSDGYLFRFDPAQSKIQNLGKPLIQYRIRGLAFGHDGLLYGVGGDDEDMARLFSYNPKGGEYAVRGFIDVNRRPYFTWQAYTVDAVTAGTDGIIYLGEAERLSKLYVFHP